eukprot:scaffold282895_cov28-Tisochrysis_lutea.AAC.4
MQRTNEQSAELISVVKLESCSRKPLITPRKRVEAPRARAPCMLGPAPALITALFSTKIFRMRGQADSRITRSISSCNGSLFF